MYQEINSVYCTAMIASAKEYASQGSSCFMVYSYDRRRRDLHMYQEIYSVYRVCNTAMIADGKENASQGTNSVKMYSPNICIILPGLHNCMDGYLNCIDTIRNLRELKI